MVTRRSVGSDGHGINLNIRTTPSAQLSDGKSNSISSDVRDFIQETAADIRDLEAFYSITFASARSERLEQYFVQRRHELISNFSPFEELSRSAQVDWLLIRTHIDRRLAKLKVDRQNFEEVKPLLGEWAMDLVELCEKRQKVEQVEGKDAAQVLADAVTAINRLSSRIGNGSLVLVGGRFAAYRSAQHIDELQGHLREWFSFYADYDPAMTWWIKRPWQDLSTKLTNFANLIREKLVGIQPGDEDAIVGQPIREKGLLTELEAEMIAYTPAELIRIGEKEYHWCEQEAIKASQALGFGNDWLRAQDHVKNMYVEPGQQPLMVHDLAAEAIAYITQRDMITIPPIANESWRTTMLSPAQQRVSPFFLGGTTMQIASPTATMPHADKLMTMRGNNKPFSRSTVFHEMVPGHHLQYHYMSRHNTHRSGLFSTPFWIEGWAFYWEMILWDRGFAATPEDKLGMLFWRMHRCARIIFSLRFHLGEMTPGECIDFLVEKVGHERATAEGEVRRSLNGDYGPLYQAAYMLGALQLYRLRKEIVEEGRIGEKEFHDRVLRENNMPIELLRALMKGEELNREYTPRWRFYDL